MNGNTSSNPDTVYEPSMSVQLDSLMVKQFLVTEVQVEASLEEITDLGDVLIKFDPPIVEAPKMWKKMWSLEEREKMGHEGREEYEEKLLDETLKPFVPSGHAFVCFDSSKSVESCERHF